MSGCVLRPSFTPRGLRNLVESHLFGSAGGDLGSLLRQMKMGLIRAVLASVRSLRSAYRMNRSRDWSKTMRPRGQSSYSCDCTRARRAALIVLSQRQ